MAAAKVGLSWDKCDFTQILFCPESAIGQRLQMFTDDVKKVYHNAYVPPWHVRPGRYVRDSFLKQLVEVLQKYFDSYRLIVSIYLDGGTTMCTGKDPPLPTNANLPILWT